MPNNNATRSSVLLGAIVALVFAGFGLASCGSGSNAATTATSTRTTALTPSRTSGVAPLAVFFDASGTTDAGVTSQPFHDLEYRWNFGDTAGGATWANGAQAGVNSKNSATGPVTSHVFETPGTYTVTLTVFDGINTATTNTAITVTDPETVFATTTACAANGITPVAGSGGCPAVATLLYNSSDFDATFSTAITAGARRILFRRGDTFSASTSTSLAVTGPGIVGAFGPGAAPIIQMTGSSVILNLSSNTTPTISDWRIVDLELDGLSKTTSIGVQGFGGINKATMLRLNIHDIREGFSFASTNLDFFNSNGQPGHALWDQIAIVDSTVQRVIGGAGGCGVYLSAQHFSLLGNFINDSTLAEHIVRLPMVVKGVISNNTLSNQAATKAILKMHGPTWCAAGSAVVNGTCSTKSTGYSTGVLPLGVEGDVGGYTEKVVISDNKLISSDGTDWTVNTGPQNAQSDERLRDIIVERNWFIPGSTTSAALVINATRETVRNNICIVSGACLRVEMRGYGPTSLEPPPTDVAVYNNTFYTASAVSFTGVRTGVGATNTVIKNNLGYAPSATGTATVISDAGTSTVGAAGTMGNSSDSQVQNTFPAFANATPSIPADFRIGAGSYAKDSGTIVPVFSDFFRSTRPQSGVIDAGAIEYP